MKKMSAVIFPDTVPSAQVLIPLVLVFEPVVYCQPVENDDSSAPQGLLCETMQKESRCTIYAPAPLGENRDRFMHLAQDIGQRRDNYAEQLAHISLAGISSNYQARAESQSSILSSLLAGHGIDATAQEKKEKLLWQARLVLKLGEQYDRDQLIIAEDIESIRQREQNLFAEVSHDDENPFILTRKLTLLNSSSDGMQRLRLKAWSRLFGLGTKPLAGERVFISMDSGAIERLCDEYQHCCGKRPAPFLTLLLPAYSFDEKRFMEQLQQFLEQETDQLSRLSGLLSNPSSSDNEINKTWNTAVEQYFPYTTYGRRQLLLYYLPGIRPRELFLNSFGHDDELRTDISVDMHQDVILGLLSDQ